jgi:peptide chain release factor 2
MEQLHEDAQELQKQVSGALERIGFEKLEQRVRELDTLAAEPELWQNAERAQAVLREQAALTKRLAPWYAVRQAVADVLELADMRDPALTGDLENQLAVARVQFEDLKEELKFSGPYDDHDAILSIHAGAGGADAQDWANMLLRMYIRYAEKEGWVATTVEESAGENPNTIKSIVLDITGAFAYGKLKSEHGVHRLVRLSPFNAESRETSFAKVEVTPKIDAPEELEIDDKDLKIDVYRSGGHGGQSVNTTDSAVRITHLPTGIVVAIQNERSQLQNKETALRILRGKLAQLQLEQHAEKVSELKGPNEQAAWGNQIRSYVLHPYKQVKDLRTEHTSSDPDKVLDGDLDPFVTAYLEHILGD